MSALSQTAQRALDVYGGAERWQKARHIHAEVSARGLAFTLKRRPFFDRVKFQMDIHRPLSRLTSIGKNPGITGILDGHDVRLENAEGEILAERKDARSYFPYGRRLFYWDDLDMAYFANYATWNYFTLPRLLMNESIEWTETRPGFLTARFPESIPTHCHVQTFRFDMATGRLVQHNYSADIISRLATAANVVTAHAETHGLVYPSARRVTPQSPRGSPLRGPILIDITVHRYVLME